MPHSTAREARVDAHVGPWAEEARGRIEWTPGSPVVRVMSPEYDPSDVDARLARLEERVEDLHGKFDSSAKGGGGIGGLGIILFVFLFAKVDELADAVRALAN